MTGSAVTTVLAVLAVLGGGAIAAELGAGPPTTPGGSLIAGAVAAACLWPAYAPARMRSRDRAKLTLGGLGLWAGLLGLVGYAGFDPVPGPVALGLAAAGLAGALPAAYRAVRGRFEGRRTLVVGDDPHRLGEAVRAVEPPVVGYVSPTGAAPELPETAAEARDRLRADGGRPVGDRQRALPEPEAERPRERAGGETDGADHSVQPAWADGVELEGIEVDRIAGLTGFSTVLRERDVDAVALGFARVDREEFFGTLQICRAHGVAAAVPEAQAAPVLAEADSAGPLVDVDLEPFSARARLAKRSFDVAFAVAGLVVLAPVMVVVAVAITLDSPGPVLYAQRRTGRLGRTFDLLKFRSMHVDAEDGTGARLSDEDAGCVDPRVTRVGKVLRRTHLDELPQLLAILSGEMSVVGPRPERPELDRDIARRGLAWERRWFLTPGLTGFAQIHDVNGFDPEEKLAWDLAYRECQSLATDLRIVLVQLWQVATDVASMLRGRAG